MHQINTVQFKTAPVGENGKTIIKHVFFFLIENKIRVSFFFIIGVPKKGGPNWTKIKNTKCQITKKSYHYRRVVFEKWINVQYFWYSLQTSIRTGKEFVLKALAKSKWFLLSLYPALFKPPRHDNETLYMNFLNTSGFVFDLHLIIHIEYCIWT